MSNKREAWETINWEGSGRKISWPKRYTILIFSLLGLREAKKIPSSRWPRLNWTKFLRLSLKQHCCTLFCSPCFKNWYRNNSHQCPDCMNYSSFYWLTGLKVTQAIWLKLQILFWLWVDLKILNKSNQSLTKTSINLIFLVDVRPFSQLPKLHQTCLLILKVEFAAEQAASVASVLSRFTKVLLIIVPLKVYKSSNLWEQP